MSQQLTISIVGRDEGGATLAVRDDGTVMSHGVLSPCQVEHLSSLAGRLAGGYEYVPSIGREAWQCLMIGDVGGVILQCLEDWGTEPVEIAFCYDPAETPNVHRWPFEILYMEPFKFIALLPHVTVIRRLRRLQPRRHARTIPHLPSVLLSTAAPSDQKSIDVSAEHGRINDVLRVHEAQRLVTLEFVPGAERNTLKSAYYDEIRFSGQPPHVWHHLGHGEFDEATGLATLVLQKPAGGTDRLPLSDLCEVFGKDASIPLAVFNVCDVGRGRTPIDLFDSLDLDALVAHYWAIDDQAARAFADAFYRHLGTAGLGLAVTRGRQRLHELDAVMPRQWFRPLLMARSGNSCANCSPANLAGRRS